jgi:hypothetical protein
MIERQSPLQKRFLVLGETNSAAEAALPNPTSGATSVLVLNSRYRRQWGRRYVDVRGYLINYGLSDAGVTPTSQDIADIAAGIVPSSLRSDALHLNTSGYIIVAALVKLRLKELGWY